VRPGILDAGYIAHPTHVDAAEILAIKAPLSVAAGGRCSSRSFELVKLGLSKLVLDDTFTTKKRQEMESILKRLGVPWQVTLYSNAEHGFAVRADLHDSDCRFAKEQAFAQAIQWFKRHLS
jgi:dienelactone hydrolase